jgi:YD repeat-containing protein
MIRNLLAGAGVLALMTGAAFAQETYSTTTTSVTAPPEASTTTIVSSRELPPPPIAAPPPLAAPLPPEAAAPDYSRTTTTRHFDASGAETARTDTYRRQHQVFYNADGQLTARTTLQTDSRVTNFPPPIPMPPPVPLYGPTATATTNYYPDGTTTTTITPR